MAPLTPSLIVTDLDGTLWHTDDAVHPDTLAALAELRSRGLPVMVATGRRVTSTREPLARIGWAPPAVMLNGSIGLELESGRRFHRRPFAREAARETLAAFRRAGIDPVVYVDHDRLDAFTSPNTGTSPEHVEMFGDRLGIAELDRVIEDHEVLSFGVIGIDFAVGEQVVAESRPVATPRLDRSIDIGGAALIVSPLHQSKWDGVLAWCERAGLDPQRVLAIGDGPNDVELLRGAAVAVSLEGSHPAALAVADHVVPPAKEGGWAGLLELL
jgi:HAD superfamily hydrolase (TIGR01484 family)